MISSLMWGYEKYVGIYFMSSGPMTNLQTLNDKHSKATMTNDKYSKVLIFQLLELEHGHRVVGIGGDNHSGVCR